jgi:hypothetical protein
MHRSLEFYEEVWDQLQNACTDPVVFISIVAELESTRYVIQYCCCITTLNFVTSVIVVIYAELLMQASPFAEACRFI